VSWSRALTFIGLTWAVLVVRASLSAFLPWPAVSADLSLLVVLYLGFFGRGGAAAFVGVALALGYLTDLSSGAPRGLHALTLALVMLVARGASNRLMVASVWQVLVVTLATALGHGALVVALTSSMYLGDAGQALWLVPLTATVTCLLAPIVFALLRRLDRRLLPDPRLGITS
jgi:rod shape-determining protein MreD